MNKDFEKSSNLPTFTVTVDTSRANLGNIGMAFLGAALVAGAYHLASQVVAVFSVVLPYLAGGMLLATLLGAFYYLLVFFKEMRARKSMRISFWDAYTALAVFTVMGYFATACMHVFQTSGHALTLWNHGTMAAVLFTVVFGIGKFVAELWTADKN